MCVYATIKGKMVVNINNVSATQCKVHTAMGIVG